MHVFLDAADIALDLAAPLESAATSFDDDHLLGLVAPTAAHQIASVHPHRRLIAHPASGAQDSEPRILFAEVGRWLGVDQVHGAGWLVLRIVG